jgi:hypothetical protein
MSQKHKFNNSDATCYWLDLPANLRLVNRQAGVFA